MANGAHFSERSAFNGDQTYISIHIGAWSSLDGLCVRLFNRSRPGFKWGLWIVDKLYKLSQFVSGKFR
ncbi:MAG: hypothetical protein DMG16_28905 [Acidobacteria bacterium]|nr:MAG: hypothetical protein DMG16_28905 [Acidobacteriota bacterium]